MTLRQMMERRAALRTEMTGMHAAAGADGALPAEVQTRWDAARTELDSLEQRMSRQALIDETDRRIDGQPLNPTDNRFEELRSRVGLLDVIRAQLPETRDAEASGRAREVSQELVRRGALAKEGGLLWRMPSARTEQRTLVATGGSGAALVPILQRPDLLVDLLRNRLAVRQLGATVLSDLTGNIGIPRKTAGTVGSWFVENPANPIPLTDLAFAPVTMSPKHFGIRTELGRNMVLQSSPDAEALAQTDMAACLAEGLDLAAIAGTGTDGQPLGIIPQAGSVQTYAKGSVPSWLLILAVLGALEMANAAPTGWAVGAGVRPGLMGEQKAGNTTDFVMTDPGQLAGLPVIQTGNAPTGTLIAGDWSSVLIGFWSELEILVNPYASGSYERGNVQVRAIMSCDVAVRNPASFAILSQATS